jgi:hypothetical protein
MSDVPQFAPAYGNAPAYGHFPPYDHGVNCCALSDVHVQPAARAPVASGEISFGPAYPSINISSAGEQHS